MILDEKYAGQAALENEKLGGIKRERFCSSLSSLYDICWLLNVRGGDISYNSSCTFLSCNFKG